MATRREVLKGLLAAAGLALLPLGRNGWALSSPESQGKRLIVILMRGAVDGLSVCVPYAESAYYELRPNVAIAKPGQKDGLIDLDGFFGLHPSLAAVLPLWQERSLAFIHASGSPAETRSHFEAQDILETALLNSAQARQGWLNGLAQVLPDNHAPTRAISAGNVLPKIFQGPATVSTLPTNLRPSKVQTPENAALEHKFEQLYAPHPELAALYRQATAARETMLHDLQDEMENAGKGAPAGDAFIAVCRKAAEMMRNDAGIQLMFMDAGGWDTHVNQGNAKGQLANKLEKFGQGIAALAQGLGPVYKDTAILAMSEFGRTVAENGNKGTDHGHGNVAWLLGGAVNGGKVHGRWPGLQHDRLWEGRDLAITTDFRALTGAVISGHFRLDREMVRRILPDYVADAGLNILFNGTSSGEQPSAKAWSCQSSFSHSSDS